MSTDRYTSRSGETPPQSPKLPADARFKGKEDYRLLADPLPTPQAEALNKLSQGQLLGLLEWLVPRDLEILDSLRSAKYLLTGQIQRLHVPVVKSPSGAIRNTSNTMRKLKSYGLVKTFQRRIGGARAGSSSLIWCLTEAGQRFLNARDGLESTRRSHRYLEPSYVHIRHTLAIAECYVQLVEISRDSKKLQLKSVEWEPDCWRPYTCDHHRFLLKPDLFVVVCNGEYEDRWFIEIDLNTEALPVLVDKCKRYYQYLSTNIEQRQHGGVFPIPVWIVPAEDRKQKLIAALDENFPNAPNMFAVITAEEFGGLIQRGAEGIELH